MVVVNTSLFPGKALLQLVAEMLLFLLWDRFSVPVVLCFCFVSGRISGINLIPVYTSCKSLGKSLQNQLGSEWLLR